MQNAKEKLSNMASAAKEHVTICKAKVEEKAEKATARRTAEEKQITYEKRKAKEARAKMELHEAKAQHAAEKLAAKQSHVLGHHEPHLVGSNQVNNEPVVGTHGHHHGHHHQHVGTVAPTTGSTVPTYPLGAHPGPTGHKYL